MADAKISELTELTTVADGDMLAIVDVSEEPDLAKRITKANLMASTEVIAMIDPQINVSSIGDVYTDVAGNTYAETSNQTRITMSNTRVRAIIGGISGHVNAGTGTLRLYNFTDSATLSVERTTSSTTEAAISVVNSTLATNNNDEITLQVKNSGAGNTFTIDSGGMCDSDTMVKSTLTTVSNVVFAVIPEQCYITAMKYVALKSLSSATITSRIQTYVCPNSTAAQYIYTNFGDGFTEANANTSITSNGTFTKIIHTSAGNTVPHLFLNTTVITGTWFICCSFQAKQDNI